MKRCRSPLFLTVLCCLGAASAYAARPLPELRNEMYSPRQLTSREIAVQLYCFSGDNQAAMADLIRRTDPADQRELERRVGDVKLRWELRLLYAAALAVQKNAVGRQFLIDQAEKADPGCLVDVFWAIHLVWQHDQYCETNGKTTQKPKRADLAWAEPLMLKALADNRSCHPKLVYAYAMDKTVSERVRSLAVEFGEFHEILAERKCLKAVPVLCDYLKADMAAAPPDQSFTDYQAVAVARSLFTLDDPAIEATAVAVADKSLTSASSWYEATRDAIEWLVKRQKPSAIPLILKGLGNREKGGFIAGDADEIYGVLVGTKHRPYLDAVRSLLPALSQKSARKDHDSELRRRMALADAQLILLMAEEKDPVPKLMAFVSDPKNENRHFAIYRLGAIKDPRVVSWAKQLVETETNWFVPFELIELLGATPGDDATEALTSLLDCRFDKIAPEKDIHYTVKDYHESIVKELENRTGFKLPPDAATWRAWLHKRDANGKPVVAIRRALEKRYGPPDRTDADGNYLHYDLPTGNVRTFILQGEKLLGTENTKRIDLKSLIGKRATIIGVLGTDIDGNAVDLPDGQSVQLADQKNYNIDNIPLNAFVWATGIVQRGPWDYRLEGKLELKTLYSPKSEPPPIAQPPADGKRRVRKE